MEIRVISSVQRDESGLMLENHAGYRPRCPAPQTLTEPMPRTCRYKNLSRIQFLGNYPLTNTPILNPMNQHQRRLIFERLRAANPEPRTELNYTSPFELLVAVILSAQATDKGVNKATASLYSVANTPSGILSLGEDGLKEHIKTIGLFNVKAKNILQTCALLLERYAGEVPRDRAALEALPGVGRKTANVILNTAFGEPTLAVDTHIFRVANRTGLARGKTPLEIEKKLLRTIPAEFKQDAHHWLILHGRYTCLARKPRCEVCLIEDLCEFPGKEPKRDGLSFSEQALHTTLPAGQDTLPVGLQIK